MASLGDTDEDIERAPLRQRLTGLLGYLAVVALLYFVVFDESVGDSIFSAVWLWLVVFVIFPAVVSWRARRRGGRGGGRGG